jgi:hypothetical protein
MYVQKKDKNSQKEIIKNERDIKDFLGTVVKS